MNDDYWKNLPRSEWTKHVRKSEISPPGPVTLAFMEQRQAKLKEQAALPKKQAVHFALLALTPDERREVMAQFCKHCGSDDPHCNCWNDL